MAYYNHVFLFGSSRAKKLKYSLPEIKPVNVDAIGGGRLRVLTEKARLRLVNRPGGQIGNTTLVYFLCGIPDLTTYRKGRHDNRRYREVTFENPHTVIHTYMAELNRTNDIMRDIGCTPVFCTIIIQSIEKWNLHLFSTHQTYILLHEGEYSKMQEDLGTAVSELNRTIVALNVENGVQTPFLHRLITINRTGMERHRFNLLPDGVHVDDATNVKVKDLMSNNIHVNVAKFLGN